METILHNPCTETISCNPCTETILHNPSLDRILIEYFDLACLITYAQLSSKCNQIAKTYPIYDSIYQFKKNIMVFEKSSNVQFDLKLVIGILAGKGSIEQLEWHCSHKLFDCNSFYHMIITNATVNDEIAVLDWYREKITEKVFHIHIKHAMVRDAFNEAANHDLIDVIKWYHAQLPSEQFNKLFTQKTYEMIAVNWRINIINWCVDQKNFKMPNPIAKKINLKNIDDAAFDVFVKHIKKVNDKLVRAIIKRGKLDLLVYVENKAIESPCNYKLFGYNIDLLHYAIIKNQLDILKWLVVRTEQIKWYELVGTAASVGNLSIVKWIVESKLLIGLPNDNCNLLTDKYDLVTNAATNAIFNGHMNVVYYCNNCLNIDPAFEIDILIKAAENNYIGVFQFYEKRIRMYADSASKKSWYSLIKIGTGQIFHQLINISAQAGNVKIVSWLRNLTSDRKLDHKIFSAAIERGHLAIIEFLYEVNPTVIIANSQTIDSVAAHGYVDILDFYDKHYNLAYTEAAINRAAENGHIDVLYWFRLKWFTNPVKYPFKYTRDAIDGAIRTKQHHIVTWFSLTFKRYPIIKLLCSV